MNPKLKLAIASAIFALVAIGVFLWRRPPTLPPIGPKFVAQRRAFSGAPRARLTLKEPVPSSVLPCLALWEDLRSRDLTRAVKTSLPADGKCTEIPDSLAEYHLHFREACAHPEAEQEIDFCTLSLLDYRAHITQYLTKDIPLSKISDLLVLSDKLVALDTGDGKEMLAVAERMLEVNPQFYPAAKGALVARFREVVLQDDGKGWDETIQALDRAKKFSKKDEELLEVEAAIALIRHRDAKQAEAVAAAMETQFPKAGTGIYYRAWIAAVQGDAARAKETLQMAIAKQPENPRFHETLAALAEEQEQPEAAFGMSLSYDALDF